MVDEDDLTCCESYVRLYLIGKILGESMPLKSISSKLKAKWKTSSKICIINLGNDFLLIKFSICEDYSKLWENRLSSSVNK